MHVHASRSHVQIKTGIFHDDQKEVVCCRHFIGQVASHEKAVLRLKALTGVAVYRYDCCPTATCDVVYRKDYAETMVCPKCKLPPQSEIVHRMTPEGKPRKRFSYLPVIDWLRSLFRMKDYAR